MAGKPWQIQPGPQAARLAGTRGALAKDVLPGARRRWRIDGRGGSSHPRSPTAFFFELVIFIDRFLFEMGSFRGGHLVWAHRSDAALLAHLYRLVDPVSPSVQSRATS